MPPRNDTLKDIRIGWTTIEGEVIGGTVNGFTSIKSSSILDDGFTCTFTLNDVQKEKKMNKNEELKNVDTIIITRDGNTVSAVAYDIDPWGDIRKTTCHRATAKCGPNDIFDFNIGAKLALDRLYEGYDMTPKPKRKPYNGLIRVIWDEDSFDTLKVTNGKLESQVFVLRCPCQQKDTIYEDSSFEEMKQALLNCASFTWNNGKPPKAICRDRVTHYL